jgi:hypothetical protein
LIQTHGHLQRELLDDISEVIVSANAGKIALVFVQMADGDRTSLARGRKLLGFDLDRHGEDLIQIKYDRSMEHIPRRSPRFVELSGAVPWATRWF